MKLSEIEKELGLKRYTKTGLPNATAIGAYASDLLSDVMGKAKEGQIFVTMQAHLNVAAVASLKDLPAIIIVNNYKPDDDLIAKCNDEGISVFGTQMPMFELCGELYKILK